MKKAVAIIGSPRGDDSVTYQVTKVLLNSLIERDKEFEYEIIQLSKCKINFCKGCYSCFTRCASCNQFSDDIYILEEKMLKANLIIFASPVYAHSITGTMKVFIDRISYWLHIFKLAGKAGLTISISNSNGNVFVNDYLSKMMEFMGVSIIDNVVYSNVNPLKKNGIDKYVDNIVKYFATGNKILNLESKDKVFQVYKKAYYASYEDSVKNKKECVSKEVLYWKENGFFECNSFQELHDKIKN